jgi:hypothetical protein
MTTNAPIEMTFAGLREVKKNSVVLAVLQSGDVKSYPISESNGYKKITITDDLFSRARELYIAVGGQIITSAIKIDPREAPVVIAQEPQGPPQPDPNDPSSWPGPANTPAQPNPADAESDQPVFVPPMPMSTPAPQVQTPQPSGVPIGKHYSGANKWMNTIAHADLYMRDGGQATLIIGTDVTGPSMSCELGFYHGDHAPAGTLMAKLEQPYTLVGLKRVGKSFEPSELRVEGIFIEYYPRDDSFRFNLQNAMRWDDIRMLQAKGHIPSALYALRGPFVKLLRVP